MGEEPYYIDKLTDFITENALKPEDKDFNLTVMYGSDVTGSQVADAARRYPMMAERQVVVVKEVQNLKNTDHIAAYLAKPAQTTVLVMSKDFNSFELRDAIVNRNVFKANQIINYFDSNPKAGSIYSFLPMLFNYFQNLMVAYYCPQKDRPESLAQWLELRSPWAAKDYMTGMRNFSATKVMQIIYMIREIDAKSKGVGNPNTPPGELMKELLFFILH